MQTRSISENGQIIKNVGVENYGNKVDNIGTMVSFHMEFIMGMGLSTDRMQKLVMDYLKKGNLSSDYDCFLKINY